MTTIDLNADLAEGAPFDDALAALVSSINIACGAHAGSLPLIRSTIGLAVRHGIAAGAHPGYPDRANVGRVAVRMAPGALVASCEEQVRIVYDEARAAGLALAHVKPHGALYNDAARDDELAELVATAVCAVDRRLRLFGPPGSALARAATLHGLRFVSEGFADRAYRSDGSLVPRSESGAVLHDPALVARRALQLARGEPVETWGGTTLALAVDSICLHGDTPGAVDLARAVRRALLAAGIAVTPP